MADVVLTLETVPKTFSSVNIGIFTVRLFAIMRFLRRIDFSFKFS